MGDAGEPFTTIEPREERVLKVHPRFWFRTGLALLLTTELVVGALMGVGWLREQQRREFAEGYLICFRVGKTLIINEHPFTRGRHESDRRDEFEDPVAARHYLGVQGQILKMQTDMGTNAGRGCNRGFAALEDWDPLDLGEPNPDHLEDE